MPTYELALMLRTMSRVRRCQNLNYLRDTTKITVLFDFHMHFQPDLVSTITRTSQAIFSKGGFLRKIDNIGEQKLPFKISKNSQQHLTGNAWSK